MATEQQQIIPLIDVDTSIFAEHYQQGLRWFLFEQHDRAGPLSDEDIVATFKSLTYAGLFDGEQEQSLRRAVGAYLGTIHAGVLSPGTGQLRPGVAALAAICNLDATRGYLAGRGRVFFDWGTPGGRETRKRLVGSPPRNGFGKAPRAGNGA